MRTSFLVTPSRSQIEKRRYPRIAVELPGTLELRTRDGRRTTVAVTVRSAGQEGIGIAIDDGGQVLPELESLVTIAFLLHRTPISLPGRVVWTRRNGTLGVRLMLDLAMASARESYGSWIAERLSRPLRLTRAPRPAAVTW